MLYGIDKAEDNDILTEIGDSGRTIVMSCNHRTISNLVRSRLMAEINWPLLIGNEVSDGVVRQQIFDVISRTKVNDLYRVQSSDMTGFGVDRNSELRKGQISGVCFTSSCKASEECHTL